MTRNSCAAIAWRGPVPAMAAAAAAVPAARNTLRRETPRPEFRFIRCLPCVSGGRLLWLARPARAAAWRGGGEIAPEWIAQALADGERLVAHPPRHARPPQLIGGGHGKRQRKAQRLVARRVADRRADGGDAGDDRAFDRRPA